MDALRGARVVLEPSGGGGAARDRALAAVLGDAETMRYLLYMARLDRGGWTEEEARERREQRAARNKSGEAMSYDVIEAEAGALVGQAGFGSVRNGVGVAGVLLGAAFHRRGYGTEALLLLLEHGFGRVGLARVEAGTSVENEAMRGLFAAFGFRFDGEAHRDGHRSADYSLDAASWPATRQKMVASLARRGVVLAGGEFLPAHDQ